MLEFNAITITGTRSVKGIIRSELYTFFKRTLDKYDTEQTSWFVGGATGVDTWVLDMFLIATLGPVTIVVPNKVKDQPLVARQSIERALRFAHISVVELSQSIFPHPEAFHYRNRFMVDRSDRVISYPHKSAKSSGTKYTMHYAIDTGTELHSFPIGS